MGSQNGPFWWKKEGRKLFFFQVLRLLSLAYSYKVNLGKIDFKKSGHFATEMYEVNGTAQTRDSIIPKIYRFS